MNILKVKKFINPEQNVDKERIIIASFELLYSNVTELIGKPIDYKNYKNFVRCFKFFLHFRRKYLLSPSPKANQRSQRSFVVGVGNYYNDTLRGGRRRAIYLLIY